MNERFTAPGHLSDRSKALWSAVVPQQARSVGRLAMVQAALEALDRADSAREAIAGGDLTTTTKTTGAVHINPLVKVERESRQQFANIWQTLQLHFGADDSMRYEYWLEKEAREAAQP